MRRRSHVNGSRCRIGGAIRIASLACAMAVTLSAPLPLAAHHSFSAEFDATREIKITGEVSKVEWMNPHAWVHLTVQEVCERQGTVGARSGNSDEPWVCAPTDAQDEAVEWGFELASPNGLMRQGWTRNSLGLGDRVTIEGSRARDDSPNGNARVVMRADGTRLFAGSSQGTTQ